LPNGFHIPASESGCVGFGKTCQVWTRYHWLW